MYLLTDRAEPEHDTRMRIVDEKNTNSAFSTAFKDPNKKKMEDCE